jgi:hypothetical protein
LVRRVTLVADQVSGVRQAGAVMTRHTVKEDWLPGRVGKKVGGDRHLLESRARASHRHDHPADSRLAHKFCLVAELGIGRVDRRQGHDRPDSLTSDDPAERAGPLPGAPHEMAWNHNLYPLLEPVITVQPQGERGDQHGRSQTKPESQPEGVATIHA